MGTMPPRCASKPFGRTTLARMDLSQSDYDRYYAGFANSVLWPVFHEQLRQARLDDAFFSGYERVNRMFASRLAPLLQEDDFVWIHDYHLIPLAAELRRLGCRQRIGFFNHIPFPTSGSLASIPQHQQLVRWLFSYDLVGMQTRADVENFHRYVESRAGGHRLGAAHVQAFGRTVRTQHFPIGIDPAGITAPAPAADAGPGSMRTQLRGERARRMLMVCAACLDYTKGLAEGLEAFQLLLERHPRAYEATRVELEARVAAINARYGGSGWKPVLYFNEAVDHRVMPEFFRLANVRREDLQWWRTGYLEALGQGAGEGPDRQRATRSSHAISWARSAADSPAASRPRRPPAARARLPSWLGRWP